MWTGPISVKTYLERFCPVQLLSILKWLETRWWLVSKTIFFYLPTYLLTYLLTYLNTCLLSSRSMLQSRKKIFVLVNTGCLVLGQKPRPVIVGWHQPLSPNVYFNISRKSFISSVPSQNCHFKRHINLFHLQTLMNACPVTVSALNSASILQAPIFADAVLDSFWIQMAELAQVNLNPLSSGWRHLLKAANKSSFRSPFLLYL